MITVYAYLRLFWLVSSLPDSILSSGLPLPSLGGHANWHCHLAPLLGGLVNWDCHYHHWAQWAAPSTGTANTTTPTGTATTIIGRPRQLPLHRWASPSTGTATTVISSLGVPVNWHCMPPLGSPVNWDCHYHHWVAPSTGTTNTTTLLGDCHWSCPQYHSHSWPTLPVCVLVGSRAQHLPNTSPTDNSCKRSRAFRLSWCRNLLPGSSLRYCNWPTADWLSWSLWSSYW